VSEYVLKLVTLNLCSVSREVKCSVKYGLTLESCIYSNDNEETVEQ
jgi:hypothetical protein